MLVEFQKCTLSAYVVPCITEGSDSSVINSCPTAFGCLFQDTELVRAVGTYSSSLLPQEVLKSRRYKSSEAAVKDSRLQKTATSDCFCVHVKL